MLKLLDQYIVKKYLSTFFFTVLVFSMISIIIDFSDKADKFVEKNVTTKSIVFDYYINFLLYIAGLLFPLYALIAVIFFTSRLAYNSEIISILNAGVSFKRLMKPYFIAAGCIFLLHLIGNHFIIPKGNKTRLNFEHKYVWPDSDKGKKDNVHLFLSPTEKLTVRSYLSADSMIRGLRLEKVDTNNIRSVLDAAIARWDGKTQKWRISDYKIRTFDGFKESFIQSKGTEKDTAINITPLDFVRYQNQKEMLTTAEMQEYIRRQQARGLENTKTYEIEMHRRTAEPFSIVILTIIGMAVAARKVRGGMGFHLAIGVGLGAIFVFLSKFSTTFANIPSVPSILGVWIPNIVFALVAAYLVKNAQK